MEDDPTGFRPRMGAGVRNFENARRVAVVESRGLSVPPLDANPTGTLYAAR